MEVFDVLHVDGGTADVFDACACCVKNVLDVLQCLGCLLASGFASQFAGGRVDAELAGDEHETVGLHGLAVSAQRRRGFRSRNRFHLLAHNVSPLKNVLCMLLAFRPRQTTTTQSQAITVPMESTRIVSCSKYRLRAWPFTCLCGGLDGDRTHDLLFRRQTLYPLSYKPVRQPTLHCLEMKATLFTEKRSSNLGSLLQKHSYGGSFDSTPNPRGEITGIERGRNER